MDSSSTTTAWDSFSDSDKTILQGLSEQGRKAILDALMQQSLIIPVNYGVINGNVLGSVQINHGVIVGNVTGSEGIETNRGIIVGNVTQGDVHTNHGQINGNIYGSGGVSLNSGQITGFVRGGIQINRGQITGTILSGVDTNHGQISDAVAPPLDSMSNTDIAMTTTTTTTTTAAAEPTNGTGGVHPFGDAQIQISIDGPYLSSYQGTNRHFNSIVVNKTYINNSTISSSSRAE